MLENLTLDLSVDQLAARAHMSPRTFARRSRPTTARRPPPGSARQRIIHAQRLLEQTDLGLDAIAAESGFGSAAVLRQNFTRMGLSPTAYRAPIRVRRSGPRRLRGCDLTSCAAPGAHRRDALKLERR
jgi:transcriptional regulator GlxA family with amidase domain